MATIYWMPVIVPDCFFTLSYNKSVSLCYYHPPLKPPFYYRSFYFFKFASEKSSSEPLTNFNLLFKVNKWVCVVESQFLFICRTPGPVLLASLPQISVTKMWKCRSGKDCMLVLGIRKNLMKEVVFAQRMGRLSASSWKCKKKNNQKKTTSANI